MQASSHHFLSPTSNLRGRYEQPSQLDRQFQLLSARLATPHPTLELSQRQQFQFAATRFVFFSELQIRNNFHATDQASIVVARLLQQGRNRRLTFQTIPMPVPNGQQSVRYDLACR